MVQKETVNKQAKKNVEIAGFNILHTFLEGKIAPNCILRSNFLAKIAVEVGFKANELLLYQGDRISVAPVLEENCDKKKKEEIKSKKFCCKMLND